MMIEIDGLTVRYPDRTRPALDRLSETIEQGEVIAVTGPSGCGKSTLCRALAGFVPGMIPAEVAGRIEIDGESVWASDPARIATRLGLIQQDPDAQICTLNVWQEVAFGPENLCLSPEEVAKRVEESLEFVGIAHLAERTTTTLSGGEKQRLAIASILAMAPETIILDEPTAGLDPEGREEMLALISRLGGFGINVLVSSHVLGDIERTCDWVLMLDGGTVLRSGPLSHLVDADVVEVKVVGDSDALVAHLTAAGATVETESWNLPLFFILQHDNECECFV